ncbi:porin family protein [Acetobacteroides hydrogenigenes]|uniref:Outer membrane protein with beta-barrel domain n=1 Tax=Acetobacteroides hydrogenigenes TaxID=979970 RepID=A0A4R2E9U2_9BACT|nr:porin family protein [Acetobacteroides hydrogenigenes]TCN64527.1 outer membrane protein with beta-barrel domain [Acetobacteroides hydrogenigenes]
MRKFFLIVVLLGFTGVVNAQLVTFGLKAGVNTTTDVFKNVSLTNDEGKGYDIINNKAKVGFLAGAYARVSILGFFVQPELYYAQSSTEITLQEIGTTTVSKEVNKLNTLNIPILFGTKFGPLRVNAGPVATIILSNTNIVDNVSGLDQDMDKANWGLQAGVGLDISKISLDARYETSISKLGSAYNTASGSKVNFGSRPQQFIFTLGLKLF